MFQYQLLNLINTVFQMEAGQIFSAANSADGGGLENQTGGSVGIIGGCNDAGTGGDVIEFLWEFCSAENQTIHIHLKGSANHLGLIAANGDCILSGEQGSGPAFGHCNDHFTSNGVGMIVFIVDDLAFQNGK